MPLTLDGPPSAEQFNDVVRAAGAAAKSAMRVEVPFETVAPADGELWTGDSSQELVVPIGRAGAMRLQSVRLGRGTSQHLLVAGKTGSGKSTFLHAFITNAALHYSPDQVEFYLIDFKKGVEFKTYATHRLPHARVIAIESEREFGLSVLERLDGELRRRGELFRVAGVQDLAGYRAARPGEPMPRVLLVIDEFQELFVEDDKLAQDAALLLGPARAARPCVRRPRDARLANAQRGVLARPQHDGPDGGPRRAAVQRGRCPRHPQRRTEHGRPLSEPPRRSDLQRSERPLGRQPAVSSRLALRVEARRVSAQRRENWPRSAAWSPRRRSSSRAIKPADPAENEQLAHALANGDEATPAAGPKAWLGAAVAIKEPTFVSFPPHAGSNLLVVGSEEESAFGVLANAVVALGRAKLAAILRARRYAARLAARRRLASDWPNALADAGDGRRTARHGPRSIAEVAAEVARREAAGEEDAAPWYLVIHDAGRFRDLRRNDDDFSFSMDRDKPPRPDKQWAEILRNGPAWGVHSLVWCDSYNDVNRLVDRQTLREFELRVLFQMSAADSTNLLDTPAASRLRQHRGLFYSDDLGTQEKFRPYGPPSDGLAGRGRQAAQAARASPRLHEHQP